MRITCEHGQILMTINNLYHKVSKRENWQLVAPNSKKSDEEQFEHTQLDFDDQVKVEMKALKQLDAIEQFSINYEKLMNHYKARARELKELQMKKKLAEQRNKEAAEAADNKKNE